MEGPVKQAVAPLNTDHRGGVATVQGVLVVEMLAPSHGLLEVCRPKRERFAPRHADVVVQLAVAQERALAGRPQGVVHNASFELSQRVLGGARVIGGGTPREAGPFGKVVDAVGLIGGKNVMPRMFSEHEQFVEVLVGGFGSDFGGLSGDFHRRDHPVVNVGRHARNAVGVRCVVASSGVAVEPLVLERLPAGEGGSLPALESPNGVNGRVDVALLKQGPALVEVGQLMFHHHGLKRQVAVVGFHLEVHLGPAALEALLA